MYSIQFHVHTNYSFQCNILLYMYKYVLNHYINTAVIFTCMVKMTLSVLFNEPLPGGIATDKGVISM